MSTWKKFKLAEVCTKIGSGSTPRGGDASYKTEGISLIRSQNVLDFEFSKNGLAFIDDMQAKELANVAIQEGDVLLNITGDSVARVCQVPNDVLPARVNQHVLILRTNKSKLNPDFLKYSLLTRQNKEMLLSLASTGATRKALTKVMLEEFEIDAPDDTDTQTRIASILSALDDKIELNRQMNQTLEQMAQALFKKYFVDDIDADNLPKGWRWGKLGEMIVVNQNSITRNSSLSEIEYYDTSSITLNHFQLPQKLKIEDAPSRAKRLMKHKSILYSTVRPNQLHYGIIRHPKTNTVASTGFAVIDANEMSSYFVFGFLSQPAVIERLDSIAEASATTFPAFNPERLREIELLIPPYCTLSEFEKVADTLYEKIYSNQIENEYLTKLRDTLLPKLMSGEVEVNAEIENEIFS